MATIQGMCKNCGALIVFDNRDDKCECVFCNCVFPAEQAVEILENPDGVSFPNEKFEATSEGRHYHSTRVYSDDNLEKAIKRDEVAKSRKESIDSKNNEYEISPKDVKAPAKVVWGLTAGIAALVIITIVIATPMYKTRKELTSKINNKINSVFADIVDVDTTIGSDGKTSGYLVYGQTCQNIKFFTEDSVSEEQAVEIFNNYCDLRNEARGVSDKKVDMLIYADNGIFDVNYDGNNVIVSEN